MVWNASKVSIKGTTQALNAAGWNLGFTTFTNYTTVQPKTEIFTRDQKTLINDKLDSAGGSQEKRRGKKQNKNKFQVRWNRSQGKLKSATGKNGTKKDAKHIRTKEIWSKKPNHPGGRWKTFQFLKTFIICVFSLSLSLSLCVILKFSKRLRCNNNKKMTWAWYRFIL